MEITNDFLNGENDSIFTRLRKGISEFTLTQQTVCSYTLEHYQKVPFTTVEKLAQSCGVSPASVVRTVKALGYDSYRELQSELEALLLGTKVSLWWELERSFDDNDEEFPLARIVRDNIEALQESITPHMMQNYALAVGLLLDARFIYIVGMRSSRGAAIYFHSMMNQMLANVRLGGGNEVLFDDLVDLGPKDVLIGISLGGPHHAKATCNAMKFAARNSVPSILITNSPSSPCAEFATVALYVPSASKHYSITPCMTLLESLVVSIGKKYRGIAKEKLRKLEEVLVSEDITY